ncbi:unnamed protein product [Hymenolepis diminuta]|uniref:Uncharacterized protein n=1 Tax=Hymenolepis diminuta TaxID=6216 RepID=A0A564Z3U5_HYMDI|nr:unnamed protein product [Hymenolepis diminuta]
MMTMSKFKPQRPGNRPGCNHYGDKHHSKHRNYSQSSESSDEMYKIKHEAHCPLYSSSTSSSSSSDSSSLSFEQEYYQMMKHKHESRSKNRPRHHSTSPKAHRKKSPRNASKVAHRARSSSARPFARPDKHYKSNQRGGNFRKRHSSGTSSGSDSDSQQNYSNFKQSPRRGNKRRSPSYSSSSRSSHDSSCPNYKPRNKGQRSSRPRDLSGNGRPRDKDMIPLRDKSQKKHKPGCKYASQQDVMSMGQPNFYPMMNTHQNMPYPPPMMFDHDKHCPYRYDSRRNSKSCRNSMPTGKPKKSSRHRSSSSSSSSDLERDYRQKHVRKSSKPKSPPRQHKREKSKSRPKGK